MYVIVIIHHYYYDSFSMVYRYCRLQHKNNVHRNAFLNW